MGFQQDIMQCEPSVAGVLVACGGQILVERCMRLGIRFRAEKQDDALPRLGVDAMAYARLADRPLILALFELRISDGVQNF